MIEEHQIKATAILMHWDGSRESAKEIIDHLIARDIYIASGHHRRESGGRNEFQLTVYGGENRMSISLSTGEIGTLVIDANGTPIALTQAAITADTIVLQEGAPRAIGQ